MTPPRVDRRKAEELGGLIALYSSRAHKATMKARELRRRVKHWLDVTREQKRQRGKVPKQEIQLALDTLARVRAERDQVDQLRGHWQRRLTEARRDRARVDPEYAYYLRQWRAWKRREPGVSDPAWVRWLDEEPPTPEEKREQLLQRIRAGAA